MRDSDGMGARVLERLGGSLPALRQQVLEVAEAGARPGRRTRSRARDVGPADSRHAQGFAREARLPPLPPPVAAFRQLLTPIDRRLANIERHLGIADDEEAAPGFRGCSCRSTGTWPTSSATSVHLRLRPEPTSRLGRGGRGPDGDRRVHPVPAARYRKINCLVPALEHKLNCFPAVSRRISVMSWRSAPAPGRARRYPVLAIRDFRLLLVDRLLGPFSVGFSLVGVSFAVLKVTGSTADLSYVIAAQTAPMLVFSLVSGVFADRFRPQRVIIAGNLAVVVGEGVFGLLMLVTGHPPLWAMIGLEAVNGIGSAMFYPASQALLPQLVPDTLLQEGSSISLLR